MYKTYEVTCQVSNDDTGNADKTCSQMVIGLHRMRTSNPDQNSCFQTGREDTGLLRPERQRGVGSKQWDPGTEITAARIKAMSES